ncbi:unnamed protein product [Vitrella brassicaformis CCMP3155]|uniref:Uncharacterized protein n=1 Tax=Vitrella brassicaformis (strain CCMP3155) TaxID=1169540 RepID=A0A0G4GWB7_VITBC|nr:unnamed protein product [Vitrella brassicaformis CCMP3155]|eukprot:CEM35180.1 unnamed protein product [Vitrella brassicaformis CCMP3155]
MNGRSNHRDVSGDRHIRETTHYSKLEASVGPDGFPSVGIASFCASSLPAPHPRDLRADKVTRINYRQVWESDPVRAWQTYDVEGSWE